MIQITLEEVSKIGLPKCPSCKNICEIKEESINTHCIELQVWSSGRPRILSKPALSRICECGFIATYLISKLFCNDKNILKRYNI